eukprot:COSAG05_NODE_191_length_14617_cov_90.240736_9_plen_62_part_00
MAAPIQYEPIINADSDTESEYTAGLRGRVRPWTTASRLSPATSHCKSRITLLTLTPLTAAL